MIFQAYKSKGIKNSRIDVADVLRAIAVIGIILYHSTEHFNTFNQDVSHGFSFDPKLFEIAGIVLSGKMYSIFALLFGLSFFIQRDNREQKGKDFSLRFLWRMILLMGFGMINMGFYDGDILTAYALFGLLMGRARLFYNEGNNLKIWRWILVISAVASIAGLAIPLGELESWLKPIHNFTMSMMYVSLFVLLWYRFEGFAKSMGKIGFFGRMSMTNYFLQSLFGSFIFYGFGLGFWAVTGTLYSLLCGVVIILVQFFLLKAWARNHQRGPLEGLWRKLTYLGTSVN